MNSKNEHKKRHNFAFSETGFGISTLVIVVIALAVFFLFLHPYQHEIAQFCKQYPVLAPFILILWRFIGVVIPPIPGGVLAYTLIPILGWFWTFFYSAIGLLLGACVAFFIARKYREPVVHRFVSLQSLQKWESKLSSNTELWGFILLRMTTQPIMDFMSYLAGLSNLRFWKFFVATVISLLPSAFSYYVAEITYNKVVEESPALSIWSFVLVFVILLLVNSILTKKKNRRKKESDL